MDTDGGGRLCQDKRIAQKRGAGVGAMAKISYHFRPDAAGRELSVRHAGLRGRGRSGNRRCRYRQLRRCRRRRSRGQPDDLHGQTHGGIAQGAGQALLEDCHYDPRTGQLLAASFMDYAMPRADTLPALATALSEVPRRPIGSGCAPAEKASCQFRLWRSRSANPAVLRAHLGLHAAG